ncbi:MAG TPA: acyl-phosphate glycerol 3-phosphate acyltransferase [Spirochaetaceae bacterium]|jgi:glycerol-3-phosphate acyltransferase PlsY|nr:acyl-phosphate glycerol 3-phosphate acyltransferase [Spirochaetaceae bacterium]
MALALAIVLSYLAGSFPSAIVIGKLFFKRDPRLEGSGNAGGTNAFRVFGWKAGTAVALIDLFKGFLAAAIISRLASAGPVSREGSMLLCGVAATLGHVWTIFAGFKGGKGVATAAGAVLAFAPLGFAVALAAFALTLLSSGIVSLASMAAALSLSLTLILPALLGQGQSPWLVGFGIFASPFIFFTHRANIGRLRRGEEKRFEKLALLPRLFRRLKSL